MSLYRKYRPQDFSSLRGQDHVCEVLLPALHKQRVSHAYLFTGPRGTGKTSTARILARAINCLDLTPSGPCNACEICRASLEERLTDCVEIDAASHGLVDDARALVDQARFMPTQAKKKIYIIDEVHMLSKSAFNALLKIIEEPPEHVHFILATTEAHKVLDTIVSRCLRFDFHLAEDSLVLDCLADVCKKEKVNPEKEALELVAKQARGSFRDALSLLEQVIALPNFSETEVMTTLGLSSSLLVEDLLMALDAHDQAKAFSVIHDVHAQGGDLYQFCQSFLKALRQRLVSGDSPHSSFDLFQAIDAFFLALDYLKDPVIPELPLEMAIVKVLVGKAKINAHPEASPSKSTPAPQVLNPPIEVTSPSPVSESTPSKTSTVEPDASFDSLRFISAIKPASLRSLLKISQMALRDQELTILAKSSFELGKMKEMEYQTELVRVLRSQVSDKAFLNLGVIPDTTKRSSQGLNSGDISTVF